MNKDLKDHGSKPFVVDVEKLTVDNKNYRTVIWTGKYMQMTVMSIPPGEAIGLELHKDHDQFIRIEEGEGIVQMGDAEDNLDFQEKVEDDFAILIPAGKWHNLVNNSTEPLKLYSIYSPVEHPKNTVQKTKQGEVTKHFSGGGIYRRNLLERFFNIKPVQQADTLATNIGNTGRPEIGYSYTNGNNPTIISEIVKPVPYGNGSLISTRRITNPNTPKADTTYIAPSGQRVINPTDVTRYKSRFGLLDQLIQKRQQGGTVENTEGLYADFAVRLLKGLGVTEDQIVVDGQLNSEYSDFVINSIKAVDTPEFWSNYSEDPDNAVNEFISSITSNQEGSPEDQTTPQKDNIDFAKKGAKLKKLRKNKTMKCKCGCVMTMKKEGGKLVSKCSCGCKN